MKLLKEKINRVIVQHSESTFELLKRLIRYKTFAGYERYAQLEIAGLLDELGYAVDIWDPSVPDLKKYPSFSTSRENFNGSPNVVGCLHGSGGGKSIILNTHIDVVPAGVTGWSYDPWEGTVDKGRIYGRGASDMKGGTASLYLALRAIREAGVVLKGDIMFQSVVDEAVSGAGTLACIDRGFRADAALIPAPTDLSICTVSAGCLWFRIFLQGQAAHGALKYAGVNALDRALEVIHILKEMDRERVNAFPRGSGAGGSLPYGINIGRVSCGTWPASIPDEAVIEGRVGLRSDETVASFKNEFIRALQESVSRDSWLRDHPPEIRWPNVFEHYNRIPDDHPIVEDLSRNYRDVTSAQPTFYEATWGNDASALVNYADTPTILFGPGHRNAVYKADEYVDMENIILAARIVAAAIVDWCEAEG